MPIERSGEIVQQVKKWSTVTFVARRSKQNTAAERSRTFHLSIRMSINRGQGGDGGGKASNKEFSKQISAWYCGIALGYAPESGSQVWNSLGTYRCRDRKFRVGGGKTRGRSGVPASFYVMLAAIPGLNPRSTVDWSGYDEKACRILFSISFFRQLSAFSRALIESRRIHGPSRRTESTRGPPMRRAGK